MLLPDTEILRRCKEGMVFPYEDRQIRQRTGGIKVISYGLSSYGYDIRVGQEFKIFAAGPSGIVDPKSPSGLTFFDISIEHNAAVTIPPNSFALARSVEKFKIPRDILGFCVGKSTYARCGIIVNVTPLEPGWEGDLTIEISNTTPLPCKVYAHEGIAQVLFFQADEECMTSYADRKGKYQNQVGITLAKS